jgi:hypothetical protein
MALCRVRGETAAELCQEDSPEAYDRRISVPEMECMRRHNQADAGRATQLGALSAPSGPLFSVSLFERSNATHNSESSDSSSAYAASHLHARSARTIVLVRQMLARLCEYHVVCVFVHTHAHKPKLYCTHPLRFSTSLCEYPYLPMS